MKNVKWPAKRSKDTQFAEAKLIGLTDFLRAEIVRFNEWQECKLPEAGRYQDAVERIAQALASMEPKKMEPK